MRGFMSSRVNCMRAMENLMSTMKLKWCLLALYSGAALLGGSRLPAQVQAAAQAGGFVARDDQRLGSRVSPRRQRRRGSRSGSRPPTPPKSG